MAEKKQIQKPYLLDFIPKTGLSLVKYKRQQFIDKLGLEVVQDVVASIMKGKNVRDLTEGLTQRRVLMETASVLKTYLDAMNSTDDFENNLSKIIKADVSLKMSASQKAYLFWFVGLTGKSIQNVVRDDELTKYFEVFNHNLRDISEDVKSTYGDLSLIAKFGEKELSLEWPNLIRLLLAIGASTLTIRGSEKSLYGKTFEVLVLGSVLTLLGFDHIDKCDESRDRQVFWLSEREDKRESDATLLVGNGHGVRFDIGFIGKGNTEISLDKVSRYEREMERGGKNNEMSTIILVDKIGKNSRITEMANNINGTILQMSHPHWVYNLAKTLETKCDYRSDILNKSKEESLLYIEEKMKNIHLEKFLKYAPTTQKKKEGGQGGK
ncbi:MAG: CfrBI family restriction endonuclease [Bacteroidales bacterium]|nr:CfrBI family restriction endonuclease [Bacteroidales bacterium]